ncbi:MULTISPECIES: TIM barrel protein [unclassified Leclercia]|uniref:TIM barrel protein n=1 Tax=Leclercia barmai TaxID=2785629 RepID=A0ABS7RYY2_9ENTR|nr:MULTISPECIES: TIM barrel protein [unclassified Leclercia]MBZ0059519.1 TIM barrel protein [Leclercia sp. EMC7]MCM5697349.1 TIM barrel protein [Leclercia sp. LTM01]MCM5702056.1 TIM barrel protein [Leclercia sp. LTM14]
MYLSACIEWLFSHEYPDIDERIRAAKRLGFSHVEFHLWREKPLPAIAAALEETGVKLSSFVVEPRRSLVDPAQHDEFLVALQESLAAAQKLGSPPLVVASGFNREGIAFDEQKAQMVTILRQAATLAEEAGIVLLLEPLNTRIDHPGMFLHDTRVGLDVVEAVASPHLKLLFDVYHSTVMQEDLSDVLAGRMHLVGHVQIAQAPGRDEPDAESTDWKATLHTLSTLGYRTAVGLEYKPSLPVVASVAKVCNATGLSLTMGHKTENHDA